MKQTGLKEQPKRIAHFAINHIAGLLKLKIAHPAISKFKISLKALGWRIVASVILRMLSRLISLLKTAIYVMTNGKDCISENFTPSLVAPHAMKLMILDLREITV